MSYNLVPKRSEIQMGSKVKVIQKRHYETGEITEGIVEAILTSRPEHPRGIKVRLTSGIVGRVQALGGDPIVSLTDPIPEQTENVNYVFDEEDLV